jgi:hypothetical protein
MKNWMMIAVTGLLLYVFRRLWRDRQGWATGGSYFPSIGLLFSAFARRPAAKSSAARDDRLERLGEVLHTAELTNSSFFRSLEMVQRNLEALIARAENAEQRLHHLLTQTDLGKTDPYASAVLLLSEGKGPEQVARMLSLPLRQVELVQQLRRAVKQTDKPALEKAAAPRRVEKKLAARAALAVGKKRPAFLSTPEKGKNDAAYRENFAALSR